jgi:hypothetical protein
VSPRLFAAAALASACTMHTAYMEATWPDAPGPWIAPIIDPLTANHVLLEMTFTSEAGNKTYSTQAILDTGAWRSMTSDDAAKHAEVGISTSNRIRITDVAGESRPWTGAVIPRVRIGNLELTSFPVNTGAGALTLLGNEVLSRQPIEIDRNRGLVIFGAAPWSDGAVLQLEPGAERNSPSVEATIGDETVLLTFDTGAFATGIDVETADDLGIERKPLLEAERYGGAHSGVRTNFRYRIRELGLGDIVARDLDATPIPKMQIGGGFNTKIVGLLGQDVMSRYRMRIDNAAGEVRLQPRADLLASTAERLTRWAWTPRCPEKPGCVQAGFRVLPAAEAEPARLEVTYELRGEYRAAARLLFGFTDAAGALLRDMPLVQLGAPASGGPHTLTAIAQESAGAALWPLLQPEARAAEIVLLDANPGGFERDSSLSVYAPLDGWKRPPSDIRIKRDTRFLGPDYLVFTTQLERCIAACAVDPRCASFDYADGGACQLKRQVGTPQTAQGYVAGVKP